MFLWIQSALLNFSFLLALFIKIVNKILISYLILKTKTEVKDTEYLIKNDTLFNNK